MGIIAAAGYGTQVQLYNGGRAGGHASGRRVIGNVKGGHRFILPGTAAGRSSPTHQRGRPSPGVRDISERLSGMSPNGRHGAADPSPLAGEGGGMMRQRRA